MKKIVLTLMSLTIFALSVDAAFDADCARCLCHVQTGCNSKHPAGPYKISWPYWADGGKPTVNGEDPDSETAFKNCVKSEKCNFDTVSGYMRNFEQDCDNDGNVDCLDYIKIHVFGGYGCQGNLPPHLQKKYDDCIAGDV
uniref:lysozyme n=1 Tax=Culicoides sonorensis TaxID=179676 RepID=A0A336K7V7_CULSO